MLRAQLLINSGAWRARSPALEDEIRCRIAEVGYQLDITPIAGSGNGAALASAALQAGYDLVIAGGGDGTIQQVAAGMFHSAVPLAILPLGTMNNIARSLGIPLDLAGALAVIAAGRLRRIDLGIVNGMPFVEVVNVGAEAVFSPVGATTSTPGRSRSATPHSMACTSPPRQPPAWMTTCWMSSSRVIPTAGVIC
jgi:diacylglycerol kinase (ATP)